MYYLISINKFISYILCNKGIIVNLYKLHFPSSSFSLQSNKKVFHTSNFPLLQPNTQEEKLNIFHPPIFPLLQPNKYLLSLTWQVAFTRVGLRNGEWLSPFRNRLGNSLGRITQHVGAHLDRHFQGQNTSLVWTF